MAVYGAPRVGGGLLVTIAGLRPRGDLRQQQQQQQPRPHAENADSPTPRSELAQNSNSFRRKTREPCGFTGRPSSTRSGLPRKNPRETPRKTARADADASMSRGNAIRGRAAPATNERASERAACVRRRRPAAADGGGGGGGRGGGGRGGAAAGLHLSRCGRPCCCCSLREEIR